MQSHDQDDNDDYDLNDDNDDKHRQHTRMCVGCAVCGWHLLYGSGEHPDWLDSWGAHAGHETLKSLSRSHGSI